MNFNLFSRVKNSIVALVQRWKGSEAKLVNTGHVIRNKTVWDKIGWKAFRLSQNTPRGCPVLSGDRLERTISHCSPKNLTVLPRYMRVAQERGIFPPFYLERISEE